MAEWWGERLSSASSSSSSAGEADRFRLLDGLAVGETLPTFAAAGPLDGGGGGGGGDGVLEGGGERLGAGDAERARFGGGGDGVGE